MAEAGLVLRPSGWLCGRDDLDGLIRGRGSPGFEEALPVLEPGTKASLILGRLTADLPASGELENQRIIPARMEPQNPDVPSLAVSTELERGCKGRGTNGRDGGRPDKHLRIGGHRPAQREWNIWTSAGW